MRGRFWGTTRYEEPADAAGLPVHSPAKVRPRLRCGKVKRTRLQELTHQADALIRELPAIRRAREYHLYDLRGRRYVDFHQGDGRAVLGHRISPVSTAVKNLISQGLHSPLPSVYEHRFVQALQALIPTHPHVRIFATLDRAVEQAALCAGVETASPQDPALGPLGAAPVAYWRPLLDEDWSRAEALVPVVPYPGPGEAWPVCCRSAPSGGAPASDLVSPVVLAGMAKAVWEYTKRLAFFDPSRWGLVDGPGWTRRGPYLRYAWAPEEHERVWRRALERGVLLAPRHPGPSIVPPDLSRTEIQAAREVSQVGGTDGS